MKNEIKFYEEVVGTMGSYGYGEMAVSRYYPEAYESGEIKNRTELLKELTNNMHPRSGRAAIVLNDYVYFVRREGDDVDSDIKLEGACMPEQFYKEKTILK